MIIYTGMLGKLMTSQWGSRRLSNFVCELENEKHGG